MLWVKQHICEQNQLKFDRKYCKWVQINTNCGSWRDWSKVSAGTDGILGKRVCEYRWDWLIICWNWRNWSTGSMRVGTIGRMCLWELAGLGKSVCSCRWVCSRVSVGVGGTGPNCLWKLMGLVKNVCRSWKDWSRMSVCVDFVDFLSE